MKAPLRCILRALALLALLQGPGWALYFLWRYWP